MATSTNKEHMLQVLADVAAGDVEKSEFTIIMQGAKTEAEGELEFKLGGYGSVPKMIAGTTMLMEKLMEQNPLAAVAFLACAMSFMAKNGPNKEEASKAAGENVVDFEEALTKLKASKSTMH